MTELIVRQVRCFGKPNAARIAPITILLGENSSGKTTFLSMYRAVWDLARGGVEPDFNEQPFNLGGYDQIANYHGGRAGRSRYFEIGLRDEFQFEHQDVKYELEARFVQKSGQSAIQSKSLKIGAYTIKVSIANNFEESTIEWKSPTYHIKGRIKQWDLPLSVFRHVLTVGWSDFYFFAFRAPDSAIKSKNKSLNQREFDEYMSLVRAFETQEPHRPHAVAPVRTKPERTYNPVKEALTPEGSHVPMILTKMHSEKGREWNRLRDNINEFASAAHLFEDLRVKRLGKTESDPFQLKVKISGPATNLIDVGYGVNQVLPILVDALHSPDKQTVLFQQPEVHLHPRGQAELGSLFCRLAAKQNKRFLIETHSDYLIDRIRADVRDKKIIPPDAVSILYFEREGQDVQIHNISLDEKGELVNVPPQYRNFFLEEERRFFGMKNL